MIWRFDPYELDEEQRELRLLGREVMVEPLVFDLLADLVRNRDRVVTKDELFDRVWAGAIVSESSLQRAVSLARSALRAGNLTDAIKTFSRRGYRFTASVTEISSHPKRRLQLMTWTRFVGRVTNSSGITGKRRDPNSSKPTAPAA